MKDRKNAVSHPSISYDLLWPLSVKRNSDFGVKVEDLTDAEKKAALERCPLLLIEGLFKSSHITL
jgi:hypothetical protein